jgi:hypothetical protein
VSILQFIMIAMADPSVSLPTLALTGWTLPAAGGPDVVVTFIAVIAVDPHVATLRWPATVFVDGVRRPNADHNLRQ